MNKRKAPPYSKNILSHSNQAGLIVCTGSGAWDRAKSSTWFANTPKIVFPYGDDPSLYKWPSQNRAVMIFDFGPQMEGYGRLVMLARELLIAGAEFVLLLSPDFDMVTVKPHRAAA